MNKFLTTSLFLLLLSVTTHAQIITSKKEAQKKGIYSYSDKENNSDVAIADVAIAPAKATEGPVNVKPAEVTDNDTSNKPERRKKRRIIESQRPDPDFIPSPEENYFAMQVVNNAMEFEGVSYRTGGTTKDGMDCSGMVYATFNIFNIKLPRSSYEMVKAGTKIKLSDVRKGDLLFFDNNPRRKRINHVGLVTEVTEDGEIKFIHATLQQGVVVSSMSETYYENSFVQATRVIED